MVSGYPTSTNIPQIDGLSTDPRDRGVTKITGVGGNLPPVAQFRVLCHPDMLIARRSFLFLFPFPLFLFFLPHFSSLFLFPFIFFPPFLFSFSLFLFSFLLPRLSEQLHVTHGLLCVTHMVHHVSPTWLVMCCPTPVTSKNLKF